jgi:hypothetical protein
VLKRQEGVVRLFEGSTAAWAPITGPVCELG